MKMVIHQTIIKAHIHDYDESFYQDAFGYLSIERQRKALRYRNDVDRLSCILGDYLLRKLISEETGCELKDVCISHTESGKPFVSFPDGYGLSISLSHSGGHVVVGMDASPIGVDVEMVSEIEDAFLRHVLSEKEAEYVGSSRRRFFEVWTMKEAYLKCTGIGISGCEHIRDVCVFGLPGEYRAKVVEATDEYVISVCNMPQLVLPAA